MKDNGRNLFDTILEYDASADVMKTAGKMSVGRQRHTVSIMDNIEEICPTNGQ